ncbi:MAG: hypothetical protein N3B18_11455 [Desulfobacterota bacterium]|nr:hypothetical protein [Thermodesulfobacteriota bacterium]
MLHKLRNFFKPMWRTIWIALAGQGVFIFSAITMSPLRMWENPVVNYNLFYLPILTVLFGYLFYRCCTEQNESRSYLYGFFAALFAWPVIGEMSTLPVEKGLITQFSDVEIKSLGGWYFVLFGWLGLKILWLTGALKRSVCVFMLTFLGIWTFELYMDNYSSNVPIHMMPVIGNYIAIASLFVIIFLLVFSYRTTSLEKKTVLGCILYIVFAVFLMGADQWKRPSKFYVTYEAAHLDDEIQELQQEKFKLEKLKLYMLNAGLLDGKSIKYLLDRNLVKMEAVKEALAGGKVPGKEIKYLVDKKILTAQDVQDAVAQGRFSEKDIQFLRNKKLVTQ